MSKELTIRGVSPELGERLERLSAEREQSVNATVLELLARAVGLDERRGRFRRYVTWSSDEAEEVITDMKTARRIDDGLWK